MQKAIANNEFVELHQDGRVGGDTGVEVQAKLQILKTFAESRICADSGIEPEGAGAALGQRQADALEYDATPVNA